MEVTIELIKELREETGAGVLDAKKALEAADGNYEEALDALRKKGLAQAAKRADREAHEGVIEVYSHLANRVGVMLELNCETDFVANTEKFQEVAHDLALHITAMAPRYISRSDVPAEKVDEMSEQFRQQAQAEGKPEQIVEKIVQGRLEKFYEENVLLEQPFVKDDTFQVERLIKDAIALLGENVVVRRFARYELGEELEE